MILVKDNTKKLFRALDELARHDVLVGVPSEESPRESGGISNAALAYIHDVGSPAANIPARPFMRPGIRDAQKQIVALFAKAGRAALEGDARGIDAALHSAGVIASMAIKKRINAGPPPPLKLSTIKARARAGNQGAREYLAFMDWPQDMRRAAREAKYQENGRSIAAPMGTAKALVVTGQMRNAVTYIVRRK